MLQESDLSRATRTLKEQGIQVSSVLGMLKPPTGLPPHNLYQTWIYVFP